MTAASYPYNESNYPDADPPIPGNPCKFNAKQVVSGTPNFFTFGTGRAGDEDQLAAFIHHNGPVSAGIGSDVFALRAPGCEERGDCFINATSCATITDTDHSITVRWTCNYRRGAPMSADTCRAQSFQSSKRTIRWLLRRLHPSPPPSPRPTLNRWSATAQTPSTVTIGSSKIHGLTSGPTSVSSISLVV